MAGKKRKSNDESTSTPTTRRQSGRVTKARVKYEESDIESQPDSDFEAPSEANSDPEDVSDDASEAAPQEKDDDEDDWEAKDDYEANLKKKGYKKKMGKDGKWEMVIEMPGKKSDRGIPYQDGRIHPNTLDFLKELKKNNKREWLKFHDAPYRQAEKDFQSFVEKMSDIVCATDSTIPDLPIKDIIYRIYRDMRFSSDPTPYKTYFSVTWSRTGRKGPYAHYYLHIQPGGGSFFGGGYYGSDNLTLACLREDIDQQPHQFKSILMGDNLRQTFFPKIKNDEAKVVAAFCKQSSEGALKTKPKGYDADHQDLALLKLRNFTLKKDISDEEITSENALGIIQQIVEAIEPFITYLNHVVMPDR